jgi:NADH-quinone oxidoreductase subunit I
MAAWRASAGAWPAERHWFVGKMPGYFANLCNAGKSILAGMRITLRYMGKKTVTLQYPDTMVPVAARYRGFHEYQIERCIACQSCLRACPVSCITLETDGKGKSAVIRKYAIDYARCIFCGLCVEPCPTECLHMGKLHDVSGFSREEAVVDFTELARQGRRTPEPRWMIKARAKGPKAPEWARILDEHYRSGPPIQWDTVGAVDAKATPKPSLSWAERTG